MFGALSVAILGGTACAHPVYAPVDAALDPSIAVDANAGGPFDGGDAGDAGDAFDAGDAADAFDAGDAGDGGHAFDAGDGGRAATPSFCDGVPGAMFCDDFEGDLSRWMADTSLGTTERDVSRGYKSGASFKSELMGSGRAVLLDVLPETVADGVTLYAQMRVLVPNGRTNRVGILWLGGVEGTALLLEDLPGDSRIGLDLFPYNTTHNDWIGSAPFKPGGWSCLDVRIALDEKGDATTPNGAVEVRIDGAVVSTSKPIFTFESSGSFQLRVGLAATAEGQGAFTAWFDDVVIATEPLPPCSEPVPVLSDAGADDAGG